MLIYVSILLAFTLLLKINALRYNNVLLAATTSTDSELSVSKNARQHNSQIAITPLRALVSVYETRSLDVNYKRNNVIKPLKGSHLFLKSTRLNTSKFIINKLNNNS